MWRRIVLVRALTEWPHRPWGDVDDGSDAVAEGKGVRASVDLNWTDWDVWLEFFIGK